MSNINSNINPFKIQVTVALTGFNTCHKDNTESSTAGSRNLHSINKILYNDKKKKLLWPMQVFPEK